MRKWILIGSLVAGGILLLIAVGVFALYRAWRHVPEFYEKALQADRKAQEYASQKMLQEASAFARDVEEEGPWQAVFTEERINGWLAVDLVRNHPDLLPSTISEPRVAIQPGQFRIGFRYTDDDTSGVLSLAVDVYLAEPNVIALRVRNARAGALPLPLDQVLERISEAAAQLDLQVRWRQAEGDPVAEIPLPQPRDAKGRLVQIESLQLGDGEIYLAGSTSRQ